MRTSNQIPLSIFGSVHDNRTDLVDHIEYDEIADFFEEASEIAYPGKSAAPLFTSSEFENGRRRKDHVLRSGLIILDVDDGATVDDAAATMSDLTAAGFIYTTASHRDDHHKFRIGIPVAANVDAATYTSAWRAMNHLFGDIADPSKKGAESLFYMPGEYPGADRRFLRFEGDVAEAEAWIESAPSTVQEPGKKQESGVGRPGPKRNHRRAQCDPDDLSIYNSRLVPERAVNAYLDTSFNWHHARYRFMCSVAGRASRNGTSICADDLVMIFNQLDQMDGGHFQGATDQQELARDAQNAINSVG